MGLQRHANFEVHAIHTKLAETKRPVGNNQKISGNVPLQNRWYLNFECEFPNVQQQYPNVEIIIKLIQFRYLASVASYHHISKKLS